MGKSINFSTCVGKNRARACVRASRVRVQHARVRAHTTVMYATMVTRMKKETAKRYEKRKSRKKQKSKREYIKRRSEWCAVRSCIYVGAFR